MRQTVFFISLVSLLFVSFSGCGIPQEKYDADMSALQAEIDKARNSNGALQDQLDELTSGRHNLESEIIALKDELQRLTGERDANAKAVNTAKARIKMFMNMLAKFKKMQESGKIKIKIVNNKMIVEMQSAILFPSAKAQLSDEGKKALSEVASVLKTIGSRNFQVAGHTDNKPINTKKFKSNWELSAARAVAVTRHMIAKGMTEENLSAAGYSDTQPAVSNETAKGRSQNRRIEIVLQPNLDELPDLSSLEQMLD